jgi:hypothetical protein
MSGTRSEPLKPSRSGAGLCAAQIRAISLRRSGFPDTTSPGAVAVLQVRLGGRPGRQRHEESFTARWLFTPRTERDSTWGRGRVDGCSLDHADNIDVGGRDG